MSKTGEADHPSEMISPSPASLCAQFRFVRSLAAAQHITADRVRQGDVDQPVLIAGLTRPGPKTALNSCGTMRSPDSQSRHSRSRVPSLIDGR
jgi:hypothetical protein